MSDRRWKLDLSRNVEGGVLARPYGGTGNMYGSTDRLWIARARGEVGTTIPVRSVMEASGPYGTRMARTLDGANVLGVLVGTWQTSGDKQVLATADSASASDPLVIALAGIVQVRIAASVTKGHFAYVSSTRGAAYGKVSAGAGAFGLFLEGVNIATTDRAWVQLGVNSAGGGGSAVAALDDLTDVTIATPASGQVLAWNGSQWVNQAPAAHALHDLTDVAITAPAVGQVLAWTGTGWVNQAPASSTSIWRPLLDGAGGIVTDETGQAVMALGPA
ncbi:MAG: hypothetical protein U0869_10530 [Chloroflexota bacterium]